MIRLTNEEKQFIHTLSNISGVNKEHVEKVLASLCYYTVLELYERYEQFDKNDLFSDSVVLRLPFFFDKMHINIEEEEVSADEIKTHVSINSIPSRYLETVIKQVLAGEQTDVEGRIEVDIAKGLSAIVNK